ncbi:uncharacterized protein K444DRAFT_635392 [Hyaloscypha bicolor E]|uniref:Chromo domain-containing protein n=1 Tax=Hyaloscypha bicolor E TaxID=1095630 RepID=A0A2J6SRG8_9HELO|nr:uncharacterized protein K444DRAFT_635392 [Hyaloscypha bicolor E]PMD53357.1 hypothetical protein K444DRAFT_635392 [Hyaloscypha bicolor E]
MPSFKNNYGTEFVKRTKKSRSLDKVDASCPKIKKVRSVIKCEPDTDIREYSKPVYEFIYQTAEQWGQKGPNASNPAAIRSPPLSILLTAPSIALLTPPLLNSRALTPITDIYGSATHTPVPQIPNNANGNIDLLLLSIPDTAAPVGDNTIRSLPHQSFTTTSCKSNLITEFSEVCNIVSEYDVIEVEDLTDLDKESQALEAGAFITPADDSDRLDLSTIRDTLPEEKLLVESTNVLIYKDIATEKGGRKYFNKDFVFVSDSLDPDLRNILDYEELPDTYISRAYSSPGNGSIEGIPTSHQDSESQQLNEKAVQETRPSAVDPEDNQFEVKRVIDNQVIPVSQGRRKKMITQYWVKWKGYPDDNNSWVNEANMYEDLIKAYRAVQTSA